MIVNNMRLSLLLLLILFNIPFLKAQEPESFQEISPSIPILKFSPLSLMDPVSSIQFALEHQIGRRQSLQHEVGYITDIMHDEKNRKGIRLRNEYRYYLEPDESGYGGLYLGPEILFIYYNYFQSGTFGRSCDNPEGCQYFQRMEIKTNKQVWAITPKVGYQFVVERFVLDLYAGLGYRYVRVKQEGDPGNEIDQRYDFFNVNKQEGSYNLPNVSMGMKFGFLLKKRAPEKFPYYKEQ